MQDQLPDHVKQLHANCKNMKEAQKMIDELVVKRNGHWQVDLSRSSDSSDLSELLPSKLLSCCLSSESL